MKTKKIISVSVFFFVIAVFFALPARAAMFDPASKWQTIETKSFRIHYPLRIASIAQKSAKILEEIHAPIEEKWNWKPWGYTEVILIDNSDESNGLSSVLPYNWMLIYAVPPPPDSSLAHYDDWLKMLLIHEYTHIVQIDAYGGAWYPFRLILRKTVAPSGVNPTWIREGVAQYDETFFTSGGRGRGTFSEMVVRTAMLENDFPSIDEIDGLGWKWPGFRAAYVYGLKFISWLIDTYGEDKFMEFDRRVRSSLLLSMINHQARAVYGKTFYELWREWKAYLNNRYDADVARLSARPISEPVVSVPIERDEQLSAPTVSHAGDKMVFTAESPHKKTEVRVKNLNSGEVKTIKKGQNGTQYSWSPDGTKIVFSAISGHKKYYRYYDLWLYDYNIGKERKRLKRLTNGERARDPDFDSSGKNIAFVVGDGTTDRLKTYNIETKETKMLTEDVPAHTQFANPRYSPDGRFIAVSVWRTGDGWRVYRYDADGKNPMRLANSLSLVIESRPAWTADGKYVVYSSDESGISNLYRVSADGGQAEMITNVLTGVFQPQVLPDNNGIIAQHYTSKGFDIVRYAYSHPEGSKSKSKSKSKLKSKLKQTTENEVAPQGETFSKQEDFKSSKYIAFGKSLFLPQFVSPRVAYDGDIFYGTLLTGGADVLGWHNWLASGTYRSDANYIGYNFNYWYNRFKPVFGAMFGEYAVNFGNLTFARRNDDGTITILRTVHYYERRRGGAAYVTVPIKRHAAQLMYYFEDHIPKTSLTDEEKTGLNLGNFAGFRASYFYGDAEKYAASISQENGRNIRLTTSVTNKAFGSGSNNEQVIFSGDWREYIRLWHHHVLALRSTGGITWGDQIAQATFGLGGALGEGTLGSAGSFNYFPLRGLPVSSFSGTRGMLFSGEYRFPLLTALRGLGTIPFFVKDLNAALFSDYGKVWNAHQLGSDSFSTFFDNFIMGVGAELRGNFIVGHGMPLHGRVGYGIVVLGRNRLAGLNDPILKSSVKNGMIILALGTSF